MTSPESLSRIRASIAVSGAWALVTVLVGGALLQAFETNQVIRSIVNCVSSTPNATWALVGDYPYVFAEEGGVRIAQMVQLRDPTWTGEVTYVDSETSDDIHANYLVVGPRFDTSGLEELPTTCSGKKIHVIALARG